MFHPISIAQESPYPYVSADTSHRGRGGWRNWHIPLGCGHQSLRDAVNSARAHGVEQREVPLVIKLFENPDYPSSRLFHGAVSLSNHDCIHVLLGRGLLPKDEAFAIGFTMGSTRQLHIYEEKLFALISHYLYPRAYRFSQDDLTVFHKAVHLGMVSGCRALNTIHYEYLMENSLSEARRILGIEEELLAAYYRMEKAQFPDAPESQRLI